MRLWQRLSCLGGTDTRHASSCGPPKSSRESNGKPQPAEDALARPLQQAYATPTSPAIQVVSWSPELLSRPEPAALVALRARAGDGETAAERASPDVEISAMDSRFASLIGLDKNMARILALAPQRQLTANPNPRQPAPWPPGVLPQLRADLQRHLQRITMSEPGGELTICIPNSPVGAGQAPQGNWSYAVATPLLLQLGDTAAADPALLVTLHSSSASTALATRTACPTSPIRAAAAAAPVLDALVASAAAPGPGAAAAAAPGAAPAAAAAAAAHLQRDGMALGALALAGYMVTVLDVVDLRVLHQNPASQLYFGERTAETGDRATGENVLRQLFQLEPSKLDWVLHDVTVDGKPWKGMIQVPYDLVLPHLRGAAAAKLVAGPSGRSGASRSTLLTRNTPRKQPRTPEPGLPHLATTSHARSSRGSHVRFELDSDDEDHHPHAGTPGGSVMLLTSGTAEVAALRMSHHDIDPLATSAWQTLVEGRGHTAAVFTSAGHPASASYQAASTRDASRGPATTGSPMPRTLSGLVPPRASPKASPMSLRVDEEEGEGSSGQKPCALRAGRDLSGTAPGTPAQAPPATLAKPAAGDEARDWGRAVTALDLCMQATAWDASAARSKPAGGAVSPPPAGAAPRRAPPRRSTTTRDLSGSAGGQPFSRMIAFAAKLKNSPAAAPQPDNAALVVQRSPLSAIDYSTFGGQRLGGTLAPLVPNSASMSTSRRVLGPLPSHRGGHGVRSLPTTAELQVSVAASSCFKDAVEAGSVGASEQQQQQQQPGLVQHPPPPAWEASPTCSPPANGPGVVPGLPQAADTTAEVMVVAGAAPPKGDTAPRWHEVSAVRCTDPVTGSPVLVLTQLDVTAKVHAERHLAMVSETEHRLLEQIFPRHVLAYMTEEGGPWDSSADAPAADAGWRPAVRDINKLATYHPEVTLLFADIQGFTPMCKSMEPIVVMRFLNDLFSRFDSKLDAFGVYKVETIDCYMVAGGLIHQDEDGMAAVITEDETARDRLHTYKVFAFAKAMLAEASQVMLPSTGTPVRMRVGLHTGPVMSGVVGTRMPRFCLFGDTVNTTSRMESSGVPGCIHVSAATHAALKQEAWTPTGGIEVKGKGLMETYLWCPDDMQHVPKQASQGHLQQFPRSNSMRDGPKSGISAGAGSTRSNTSNAQPQHDSMCGSSSTRMGIINRGEGNNVHSGTDVVSLGECCTAASECGGSNSDMGLAAMLLGAQAHAGGKWPSPLSRSTTHELEGAFS